MSEPSFATSPSGPSLGLMAALNNGSGAPAQQQKYLSLLNNTDHFLREVHVPKACSLNFEVDGIPFQAHHEPHGDKSLLMIWATLGYLPYSVDSSVKRRQLITILEATRFLPLVKFGIDRQMRILVTAEFVIANPPSPDYLFVPLMHFLQKARPFMTLIGEHL